MKALAECPHCKETLETNCKGCIDSKVLIHTCEGEENVYEGVSWKLTPENEAELLEVEDGN